MLFFLLFFLPLLSVSLKCGYSSYEGCIQCKSDNSGCQLCEASNDTTFTQGYAFNALSSNCVQCLKDGSQNFQTGCSKCNGSTGCNSSGCVKGYYYSSGICVPCGASQYCLDCPTGNTCQDCMSGYFLNSKNACSPCYKLTSSCQTCTSQACTLCASGYTLNSNGGCDPCLDPKCLNCDGGSCNQCASGYYPQNKLCYPCSVNNCTYCPLDSCQSCAVSYALNDSAWPLVCLNCSDAATLLQPGCSQCQYDTDNDRYNCTVCQDGYYLSNGNCTACPTNCKTCVDSSRCLSCVQPYVLLKSSELQMSCEKLCDTSTGAKIMLNGTCIACSAYYQGNCTKCDENHCIQCSNPTPYLRPPWNVSCVTCDLVGVDLPSTSGMVCYQNATSFISSVNGDSDAVYYVSLSCQVPSTIYVALALQWDSSSSGTVLSSLTMDEIIQQVGTTTSQVWIDVNSTDPYWTVYGKLHTDSNGNYYGQVNASIKLSGDIYETKIYCQSDSGQVESYAYSLQFYPQYNNAYTSAITVSSNATFSSENKTFIGEALFNLLNIAQAQRTLYTDEGIAINVTSLRMLQDSSNTTSNTTNGTNTTNQSVVYTYMFYSPPNWTLISDSYDLTIENMTASSDFLVQLNQAINSLNASISSVSTESQAEQPAPVFASTTPQVTNTNESLSFSVQVNQANGYILAAVVESNPIINNSNGSTNGTVVRNYSTVLDQRIPNWDEFNAGINQFGMSFKSVLRISTFNGKKSTVTFTGLNSNTTYDIYFAATNNDFPFLKTTNIYGIWTFTKVTVFSERVNGFLWMIGLFGITLLTVLN